MKLDNITIIIRSVGERTEKHCLKLLSDIFDFENIIIIKEHPFTKAILKSFEAGIARKSKWTVVIDADVLISKNGLLSLIHEADKTDENIFEIQGLILDKFFGGFRPAGNHIYRTSLLEEGIKYIPDKSESLRPETYLIKEMNKRGFPWIQSSTIIGIHDFEQYYVDIFRKAFVQAKKHRSHIDNFNSFWLKMSKIDYDFEVFFKGLELGISFEGEMKIDIDCPYEINDIFEKNRIIEKNSNFSDDLSFTKINKIINNYKLSKEYIRFSRKAGFDKLVSPTIHNIRSILYNKIK